MKTCTQSMSCAGPNSAPRKESLRERVLNRMVQNLVRNPEASGAINIRALAKDMRHPESSLRTVFPNEQSLWTALLEWVYSKLMGLLEHEVVQHNSPLEALEQIFRRHMAFVANHIVIPRIILHRSRSGNVRLRKLVRRMVGSYAAGLAILLGEAKAQGMIDPQTDPKSAAKRLVALIQGLVDQAPQLAQRDISDWLRRESERVWTCYMSELGAAPVRNCDRRHHK